MLPRTHRLSSHQEIREVFRVGKRASGSFFSFIFLRDPSHTSRFAVIVGKKTAPPAVDRNRAKRLVRETIRRRLSQIAPGYSGIILLSKTPPEKLALRAVSLEVEDLFRRARALP